MKHSSEPNVSLKLILSEMHKSHKITWDLYSSRVRNVLMHNLLCHTEAYGMSVSECAQCGHRSLHYGSCGDTCCLECGAVRREKWVDKVSRKVVNALTYHIVFTIPPELNELILAQPVPMRNLLFKAQAEALKQISRNPKYFGAETIGFLSVEHTWGSNLSFHPHIHTIFFGAGLDKIGNLVFPAHPKKKKSESSKRYFLFPAKKLAQIFKEIFLSMLSKAMENCRYPWKETVKQVKYRPWNVEICPPLLKPESIIKYLSRYVNRTAISNSRLIAYDGEHVTFSYKDYKDNKTVKEMTLQDTEFLARFVRHIPPKGFSRIRYYGFLGNNCAEKLKKVKELTHTPVPSPERTTKEILEELFGRDIGRCTKCRGEMKDSPAESKSRWSAEQFSAKLRNLIAGKDGKPLSLQEKIRNLIEMNEQHVKD